VSWVADLIGSALQNFIQWLTSTFTNIAITVWSGLQTVWGIITSTIQSAFQGFVSWARDRLSDAWSALQSFIGSVMSWISTNITTTANMLLQGFSGFTAWALDIMETAWRRFYDLIKDFGNALWINSLNILKTLVINPLWGLFETLLNKVREKLLGAIMIVTVTPIVIRGVKQVAQGKIRSGLNTIIFGPIAGGIASFILYGIVSGFVPQNPIKLPEIFPSPSAAGGLTVNELHTAAKHFPTNSKTIRQQSSKRLTNNNNYKTKNNISCGNTETSRNTINVHQAIHNSSTTGNRITKGSTTNIPTNKSYKDAHSKRNRGGKRLCQTTVTPQHYAIITSNHLA